MLLLNLKRLLFEPFPNLEMIIRKKDLGKKVMRVENRLLQMNQHNHMMVQLVETLFFHYQEELYPIVPLELKVVNMEHQEIMVDIVDKTSAAFHQDHL